MRDVESASAPRAVVFRAWRRGLWIAIATFALVAVLLLVGRDRRGSMRTAPEVPAAVTVTEAALHREPSAASPAIAALKRGDAVTVLSDRGPWIEVKVGRQTGFVAAGDVEREGERRAREERAKRILSFAPVYGVVASPTAILLAPFPFAPRAGQLPKGTVIPIHAVDHQYFAYRDRANGVAYVASADVDLVPPDPKSPNVVPDSSIALRRLSAFDVPTPVPTPIEIPGLPPQAGGGAPEVPPAPHPPAAAGGSTVEPAVVIEKVDPQYPEIAVRAQVEGSVVLDIGIDETGRVTDVQVTRGLPFGLSEAAADAVRRWRYRPAQGPGGPIPSRKAVRILFTLRGAG